MKIFTRNYCRAIIFLLAALLMASSAFAQEPEVAENKPFLMAIEDVFSIAGRGPVVIGRVERGQIKVGEEVEIVGLGETKKVVVSGIEKARKQVDVAAVGDNCGVMLRGVEKKELKRGQILAAPASVQANQEFEAEIRLLTAQEDGRRTPIFNGYRPQFFFRVVDVTGALEFLGAIETATPGDTFKATVKLTEPVALENGLGFAVREGGRIVGNGVILKIKTEQKP